MRGSLLLCLLLAACATTTTTEPGDDPERGLVVHEWGTFTSVQSSLGTSLEGLHHEEEPLPAFVYARDPDADAPKGFEELPEAVTQKLETPVLYFYSDEAVDVRVDVEFPGGILSEWYPRASGFAPELHAAERLGGGSMRWDLRVVPGAVPLMPVAPEDIWAPSREVAATPVHIGEEREMFVFYRGLGRFELPVSVRGSAERLELANASSDVIPAAFRLHVHAGGAGVEAIGAVGAFDTAIAEGTPKERSLDEYVETAAALLSEALVAEGLRADEARAMVRTWERSYFRTPGLRILYVVPRAWTDALLPLTLDPAPVELVRVLVGRIEVLTPSEESAVVSLVTGAAANGGDFPFEQLGRFAEPKLRRALEVIEDPALRSYCEGLVAAAQTLP